MVKGADSRRAARRPHHWSEILSKARKDGASISDIVRQNGCSLVTVRRHAKALGIELPRGYPAPKGIDWPQEFSRAQEAGETAAELARRLRVSSSSVDKAKAKHGAALKRGIGAGPVCNDWPGEFRRAIESGETQADLARRLGIATQTVSSAAKRLGVVLGRRRGPRAKSSPGAKAGSQPGPSRA